MTMKNPSRHGRRLDYEKTFRRHHPALFRYVHRLTGDEDVAADIAQEAFVRLLRNSVSEESVKSWLFTVATNLTRDRARTRGRRRQLAERHLPEPNPAPSPHGAVERSLRAERLRRALDRIPERDRRMLLMREEGFRYREIAEVTGVATSSVGTLLSRALDRLTEAYEEVMDGEETDPPTASSGEGGTASGEKGTT